MDFMRRSPLGDTVAAYSFYIGFILKNEIKNPCCNSIITSGIIETGTEYKRFSDAPHTIKNDMKSALHLHLYWPAWTDNARIRIMNFLKGALGRNMAR